MDADAHTKREETKGTTLIRFENLDKITDKQLDYINILSGYTSSKEKDAKIIVDFLNTAHKNSLNDLTKKEASALIDALLKVPVEYKFPCGKKSILNKQEVNGYELLGELEACLHDCPKNIDVHDCSYWARERS